MSAELCDLVCRMIDAGDIFAQIDEEAGMVRFLEDPQQYSSAEMATHLDAQVQCARVLADKMRYLSNEVRHLLTCSCLIPGTAGAIRSELPAHALVCMK